MDDKKSVGGDGGGKVSICLLGKFSDFGSFMHYFTSIVAAGL